MLRRRAIGKVVSGMLGKLAAEKAMGAPVSLLTFTRAVGGGVAAVAAASLGRTADCAGDVNIHFGETIMCS
jgi:lipid-binding SYLF domain-containing protein